MFIRGRTNVHDEAQSGEPFVVNDDLVRKVDGKIVRTDVSQWQLFQMSFSKFLHLFLGNYDYHKLCSEWVPKKLTDVYKTKQLCSSLKFLIWLSEEEEDLLSQIWG